MGVNIDDTDNTWRGPDGMGGDVRKGGGKGGGGGSYGGGGGRGGYVDDRGGGRGGGGDPDRIQQMVDEREALRRDRDYDKADRLRDELKRMGVNIDDTDNTWRGPDGMGGDVRKGGGKGGGGGSYGGGGGRGGYDDGRGSRYDNSPPRRGGRGDDRDRGGRRGGRDYSESPPRRGGRY